MTVPLTGKARPSEHIDEDPPTDPSQITRTPRPPGPNKLTSFFGWKTNSSNNNNATSAPSVPSMPAAHQQLEASPNFRSENKTPSPAPTPLSRSPHSDMSSSVRSPPNAANTQKANAALNGSLHGSPFALPGPDGFGMDTAAVIEDLQEELKEVSGELAGSIRREIELEDIVERFQFETNPGPEAGRRTSDYFSDSGSGSARYPPSDHSFNKAEDFAKQQRQAEQEKAQFKLGLSQKLQDERGRRKVLEAHIQQLGSQVQALDQERAQNTDAGGRVRELENALEDSRRRLQEEKLAKQNFEDILEGLKSEIKQYRDERDNLRDEIVPRLKARVDGLEGEATDLQKLTYENTRMQQELQNLKNENMALTNGRSIDTIAEEGSKGGNRLRSGSTAGNGLTRGGTLKRSNSVSNKEREFNERVKDIELQRDSLHKALKLVLDRQVYQNKEHKKLVKQLETERDRALEIQSPRHQGYENEVKGLKHEVNALRRRADEALQQKYQCEKGLGGLKMDLDRSEEETMSLRKLLQAHDILVPERTSPNRSPDGGGSTLPSATSASLEKAYRELQRSQAMSISKLREIHGVPQSSSQQAETAALMEKLLQSMSDVEAERDFAQHQAARYRAEAETLKQAETYHSSEALSLAEQLSAAASRVESLSQQVTTQLSANRTLRQRLAEAVSRGEREQKDSTARINSMQNRLKSLEDRLLAAQSDSEDKMASHEDEVRVLKDSHNVQLARLKSSMKVRNSSARNSQRASSIYSPMIGGKSPRLDKTTSGIGRSLDEALRIEFLEKRVAELEDALTDADKEMEEVISRMNLTQIEVIELQSARDEAMRQTRKLQAELVKERDKVDRLAKA